VCASISKKDLDAHTATSTNLHEALVVNVEQGNLAGIVSNHFEI